MNTTRHLYKRIPIIAVMTFIFALAFPSFIQAQVYLHQADPMPESTVEQAPDQIRIQFTQRVQPHVSQLRLETEAGEVIQTNGLTIEKDKLTLNIPPLEEGIYYVKWDVLGRDTFVTSGEYRFSVGQELDVDSSFDQLLSAGFDVDPNQGNNKWAVWHKALRLLDLLLVCLLSAWVIFHYFLWSKGRFDHMNIDPEKGRRMEQRIFGWAALLMILAGIGHLYSKTSQLMGPAAESSMWGTLGALLTSALGIIVLLRMAFFVALYVLSRKSQETRRGWKLFFVLLALASIAFASHGFYSGKAISHFIHLLLVVIWVAGVLGFTVYSLFLNKDKSALSFIYQRMNIFSKVSLFIIIFVILSGVAVGIVYLGTLDRLTTSQYGRILAWKLGLFVPVLLFALWQLLGWLPRFRKKIEQESLPQLGRLFVGIRVQLILMVSVIILSGLLSQTLPSKELGHANHRLHLFLESVTSTDSPEATFRAYVLKKREHLEGAEVRISMWNKEYEDLFINIKEYCTAANMKFDVFKDALIDRGFMYEITAEEMEGRYYQGSKNLLPGVWNIGVQVKHEGEWLSEYQDFKVVIP